MGQSFQGGWHCVSELLSQLELFSLCVCTFFGGVYHDSSDSVSQIIN